MPEQNPLSAVAATCEFELLKLPARHAGKCAVCRHRDRLGIEVRFMAWGKPGHIAREHGIKNRASIYRHAHAADLFERRHRSVISTYKTALKQFELGQVSSDVVRIAGDRIEIAVRQHLAGPAWSLQNWIQAVFCENRRARIAEVVATRPPPEIQEPKSQHGQQGPWMSMILKGGKFPNGGKNTFPLKPKTFPAKNHPRAGEREREFQLNRT
jgi:hypothetical protein